MSESVSNTKSSRWCRCLEYTYFVWVLLFGAVAVWFQLLPAVGAEDLSVPGVGEGMAALAVGFMLLAFVLSFLLGAVGAVSVYFDAKRLAAADADWQPSSLVFAFLTFWVPIVGVVYLYKRYEEVPPATSERPWWMVVPAFLFAWTIWAVVTLVGFAVAFGAGGLSGFETGGLSGFGTANVAISALTATVGVAVPIAFFRDAPRVRNANEEWQPEPVSWLVAGALGNVMPLPILPVLSGYYLYKRREIDVADR